MNALLRSRAALVSAFVVMALSVSMLGCFRPQGDSKEAREELNAAIGWYLGIAGRVDEKAARGLFEKAAVKGGPLATMWLARLHLLGHCGFPEDETKARELAGRVIEDVAVLADYEDVEAMFLLGDALRRGLGVEANRTDSYRWLLMAAERGHARARFDLALLLWQGNESVPMDRTKAVQLLQLAAAQGVAGARTILGTFYWEGVGVRQDSEQGLKWLRMSADQGDADASNYLGLAYYRGSGVPEDYVEAVRWLVKAAEQGNDGAPHYLGLINFFGGKGVPVNYQLAMIWYLMEVDRGGPYTLDAQFFLGMMFRDGLGVDRDYRKAAEWFKGAAEGGDATAQSAFGVLCENGQGVPQDYAAAAKWYLAAADQGQCLAQWNLGRLYVLGKGVPQNFEQAYVYFSLASAGGDSDAPADRDRVGMYLNAEQLSRTQSTATDLQRAIDARRQASASNQPNARFNRDEGGVTSTGSGLSVSDGQYLVTNAHVVAGCGAIKVVVGGRQSAGQVRVVDSANDLALVELNPPFEGEVYFAGPGQLRLGAEVAALGFPLQGLLSSSPHVTTGVVSSLAGPGDDSRFIQISAALQPGNSGGPVVDRSGNLIGVAVGKLDAILVAKATGSIPENVGFAIRSDIVAAFLGNQGIKIKTGKSRPPLDVEEIVERSRSFVARVECWN